MFCSQLHRYNNEDVTRSNKTPPTTNLVHILLLEEIRTCYPAHKPLYHWDDFKLKETMLFPSTTKELILSLLKCIKSVYLPSFPSYIFLNRLPLFIIPKPFFFSCPLSPTCYFSLNSTLTHGFNHFFGISLLSTKISITHKIMKSSEITCFFSCLSIFH